MSTESYVDSVKSLVAERNGKVNEVIAVLKRIICNHAEFDEASMGSPMYTPGAKWNTERPEETVGLEFSGRDGNNVSEADVIDVQSREALVHSAYFQFSEGQLAFTAMTIIVWPPNVLGYDGTPLSSSQLDGAMADLQRYESALAAGHIAS